ncbi:hypothetical protein GUJ93_ZPchr0011g28346 [Zizania palustris]|uniref:Disease resistance N-terminal domain-containing protein n=1 Tax=Zizania palustris TaxID=103762 RepID=A0A8J5WIJ5_ZIZPA|nr:hypothetical protein GUJ93_ZPchr0011g28346 [Zizania palustris]
MAVVGGLLASAALKLAIEKLGSAMGDQILLLWSSQSDLQEMKMTLESVEALLNDAERQSITKESVRLWLKRLKRCSYAIADMLDEVDSWTKPATGTMVCMPILTRVTMANKMKNIRKELAKITNLHKDFRLTEGMDIAKKCGGMALAAQSFGYILKSMTSDEWESVGLHFEDVTLFTMHELVHEVARSIMVDEIFYSSTEGNSEGSNCRYALLTDCSKPLKMLTTTPTKIRALHFLHSDKTVLHGIAFSSARCLRVLDLSECFVQKLPDSIGQLKQLRILTLPESIGRMEGLMHLDLSWCSQLGELPISFGKLKKLAHLNLSNCSQVFRKLYLALPNFNT